MSSGGLPLRCCCPRCSRCSSCRSCRILSRTSFVHGLSGSAGNLFLRHTLPPCFFGSDQRYTPVLLGYALSFLYFSNALNIGFMRWLYDAAHTVPFLKYDAFSLAIGVIVIFLANALSGMRKAGRLIDVIVLVMPTCRRPGRGWHVPARIARPGTLARSPRWQTHAPLPTRVFNCWRRAGTKRPRSPSSRPGWPIRIHLILPLILV